MSNDNQRNHEELDDDKSNEGISNTETQDKLPKEAILAVLQPMIERLQKIEQEVMSLANNIDELTKRAELLPKQVRQLGTKVDDMTESVNHPRIRDMLGNFLLMYDLVNQMKESKDKGSEEERNYQVLSDQIAQILRINGIETITDIESFDPSIHKVVEIVTCDNSEEDGTIARLYRAGFRTERTILRFAEVVLKQYKPRPNKEVEP